MAAKDPEKVEYGGYDYEFVEKVPHKFVCNICTKVQRNPHLTLCCGQHFCQSCLKCWFKKHGKKSCPHCREEKNFNHFLNKAQRREIRELKICCTLRQEGCQWVGEPNSLQTHLNSDRGCGYVEVSCTNKCVKEMKRKDLISHLANSCPLRICRCIYCSHIDTYEAITGHHYNICPDYPLPCPNKCGESNIKCKDMSMHRRTCPLEEVNCTNKCGQRMKRKDLERHLTEQCPLRKYKCEHCGHEDTHRAITGDAGREHPSLQRNHYDECPKIPLDCPNRCGARAILRKDMSDHRANCPLEPVECPFKEAGCTIELVKRDLDAHVSTNQQQHNHMLMQAFKELESLFLTMKKVIATDVKILREHKQPQASAIALESIQTQLELKTAQLMEREPLTIRMPNFSQYKRSGKVWHSPPFYCKKGYKMCLVVFANGTGAGAGTHISVFLLLLRGEFDDRLTWPLGGWGEEIMIQLLAQKQKAATGIQVEPSITIPLDHMYLPTASLWRVPDGEDSWVVGSGEKFADHQTVQQYNLLHDSIVLKVSTRQHITVIYRRLHHPPPFAWTL